MPELNEHASHHGHPSPLYKDQLPVQRPAARTKTSCLAAQPCQPHLAILRSCQQGIAFGPQLCGALARLLRRRQLPPCSLCCCCSRCNLFLRSLQLRGGSGNIPLCRLCGRLCFGGLLLRCRQLIGHPATCSSSSSGGGGGPRFGSLLLRRLQRRLGFCLRSLRRVERRQRFCCLVLRRRQLTAQLLGLLCKHPCRRSRRLHLGGLLLRRRQLLPHGLGLLRGRPGRRLRARQPRLCAVGGGHQLLPLLRRMFQLCIQAVYGLASLRQLACNEPQCSGL